MDRIRQLGSANMQYMARVGGNFDSASGANHTVVADVRVRACVNAHASMPRDLNLC